MLAAPQHSLRHWRFVLESLQDLQRQLGPSGHQMLICHREVEEVLTILADRFTIANIFAHQETGHKLSFDRDRTVRAFCTQNGIIFQELVQDAVIRGRKHRRGFSAHVDQFLAAPQHRFALEDLVPCNLPESVRTVISGEGLPKAFFERDTAFQPGGEKYAWQYLSSFSEDRAANYFRNISSPSKSRRSCSRLSPYLAWGCLSVRQVWHWTEKHKQISGFKRQIERFQERLWWRQHFFQKLEAEWQIEFLATNRGLEKLDRHQSEEHFSAWAEGRTGWPMVDASMRCLRQTGWVNFRMRAMLVTVATFGLWLDWKLVAAHLGRLFLDYDPGIHFGQIQMQAGLTGYHVLRLYNPVIQGKENDADGQFIHKWVPELRSIPTPWCYQPWELTPMDCQLYGFKPGVTYPRPLLDLKVETARNQAKYWTLRTQPEVQQRLPEIWEKHCIPEKIAEYHKQLSKKA